MNESTVPAVCHARRKPLPENKWSLKVHHHRRIPRFLIELTHRRSKINTRRIDDNVNGTRLVGENVGTSTGRKIRNDSSRRTPEPMNRKNSVVDCSPRPRGHQHVGARTSQCNRDSAPDP